MNTDTGAVYQDKEVDKAKARGEPLVELPYAPLSGCSKCLGRGTLKSWGTAWKFGACPKCYPDHAMKAQSFAKHLAATMAARR
ncbi:MAG: hypothetical protein NTY53_23960 [Kiritimatiellaeota bacterium]|nr:hypothetical protein [Kiritimatiellota bacterium]